ncbi:MAG TPA: ABC transporter permease [Nocardioides sp.]|nr:ABC transporter permease [Nocardioides sp.]
MSLFRFELVKLLAQWRVRAVLLVCAVVPAVFVLVISRQASLPSDTVFGRQMPMTGWAGSLVVLSFACSWGLPLLTALVAGDVFAAEDRLGTWRHLVVAVRSPRRIYLAKALAAASVLLLLLVLLAASSVVGGLTAAGSHSLIGLDGHQLSAPDAGRTVVLSWLCALAPTAAFGAVGLLGSVLFGRSPVGLALPALLALGLALAQLLPLPVALRLALPSQGLLGWRGLFTSPADTAGLWAGVVVCAVWAGVASTAGYLVFRRRDFTDTAYDGSARLTLLAAALPLGALVVLATGGLAAAGAGTGPGIDRADLEDNLATSFGHLYRLQTDELHRPPVTEAELRTAARCGQRAGGGWQCLVSWRLPGSTVVGHATYQLDVTADGKYVADGDGPKEVNGSFPVRTPRGDVPNPLGQFDGLVDLLPRSDR